MDTGEQRSLSRDRGWKRPGDACSWKGACELLSLAGGDRCWKGVCELLSLAGDDHDWKGTGDAGDDCCWKGADDDWGWKGTGDDCGWKGTGDRGWKAPPGQLFSPSCPSRIGDLPAPPIGDPRSR